MPTVPTYNGPQVTPGVQSGGGLNVQVSPNDMGAGLAQGVSQFGRAAVEIYKEERDRAEQIQLRDALRQAQDTHTKMLYDPNEGIMFKKGADLYSNAQKYTEDFNGQLDGIRDRLPSDRVKERFDSARGSLWNDFNKSLSIRVGQERFETSKVSMDRYVDSTVNRVATEVDNSPDMALPRRGDGYDFSSVDEALGFADSVAADHVRENPGRFQGTAAEEVKQLSRAARAKAHQANIGILLSKGDTARAKAYKERYSEEIPYQFKDNVNSALQNGSVIDEARSKADNIIFSVTPDPITGVALHPDAKGGKLTPAQQERLALEEVKNIKDAKVREQVQAFVLKEFQLKNSNKQQRDTEVFESYYDKIQKGLTLEQLVTQPDYQALTAQQQENLKSAARRDTTFDEAKIYRYRTYAYSNDEATRDYFRSLDLTNEPLTDKELKVVGALQAELQKSYLDDKGKLDHSSSRTRHQIIEDAMREVGWSDKKDDDRKLMYRFQKQIDEDIRALEQKSGKAAVPADIQKAADDLLKKVLVPGSGWFGDKKKFWFEVDPIDQARPDVRVLLDSIPELEQNKLRREYKAKFGKDPSNRELEDFYTTRMRLDRATRGLKLPTK